jgi:hypothetical protein
MRFTDQIVKPTPYDLARITKRTGISHCTRHISFLTLLTVGLLFIVLVCCGTQRADGTPTTIARAIVVTKSVPRGEGITQLAILTARRRIAELRDAADNGAEIKRPVYLATAPGLNDQQLVNLLRLDPNVIYAEPDAEIFAPDTQFSPAALPGSALVPRELSDATPDWYIQSEVYNQIAADVAGKWIKAQPNPEKEAYIAILDSGIDVTSPILAIHKPSDGWGKNYIDPSHASDVMDNPSPNEHGTKVASAIQLAISADSSLKFWAAKLLDSNGHGTVSDVIAAVSDVLMMKENGTKNFVAINMSLGFDGTSMVILRDLVADAGAAGITVVVAAGNQHDLNSGPIDLDTEPLNSFASQLALMSRGLFNQIAVAATNRTTAIADFSATGHLTVEQCAPGSGVLALGIYPNLVHTGGTSLSAPLVTGAAAELALRRGLDPLNIRKQLNRTAAHRPDFATQVFQGDFLDIGAALTTTPISDPPENIEFSGKPKYNSSTGVIKVSGTAHSVVFCRSFDGFATLNPDGSFDFQAVGSNPGKLTAQSKDGGASIRKVKVR